MEKTAEFFSHDYSKSISHNINKSFGSEARSLAIISQQRHGIFPVSYYQLGSYSLRNKFILAVKAMGGAAAGRREKLSSVFNDDAFRFEIEKWRLTA